MSNPAGMRRYLKFDASSFRSPPTEQFQFQGASSHHRLLRTSMSRCRDLPQVLGLAARTPRPEMEVARLGKDLFRDLVRLA